MSTSAIKLLENFAGYCAVKNKVISNNIANIGTQNYRSEEVQFKDVLNDNLSTVLKTTDSRHFGSPDNDSNLDYEITQDKSNDNVSGINNVDIDKQMSELAQNTLNFKFAANRIGDYFKKVQMVIKGDM